MATPTLKLLRTSLPGAFLGGLVRPGIDDVLDGLGVFDEVHVERASGIFGPKHVAAKVRPRRYDTALLLTNSFSTALVARIAGIPRRVGYDRDGRGFLLTDRIKPPRRSDGRWAIVAAVEYYWRLGTTLLGPEGHEVVFPEDAHLWLQVTQEQDRKAQTMLAAAGIAEGERLAILNPGGNDPSKRWPPDRFAALGRLLTEKHGYKVLVNGAPSEQELSSEIAAAIPGGIDLAALGGTLGSLKGVIARTSLMVTNDTGPRHIAAALGVPLVTLFGPTDHRWTSIPVRPGAPEALVLADPTLPIDLSANDHPERCRIERIDLARVVEAVERVSPALKG
ncbi:MAG: glycosyltransferase family 9 protein [Phycisphaeraceae bacterium]|nr:glycosyltransferase family 9 protein [Phycisphaeraceae bacterium]